MIYMENRLKLRYYLLKVEKDIFNTWCLKKVFGSLVSQRSRTIVEVYHNEKEAWEELTEVEYKKRQRGYVYADLNLYDQLVLKPQNLHEIKNINYNKHMIIPQTTSVILKNPNQLDLFDESKVYGQI